MDSQHSTTALQVEQARPQPVRSVLEALEAISRLAQAAFQNADHLYRSDSIKRGIAYASLQRTVQNNEGGK